MKKLKFKYPLFILGIIVTFLITPMQSHTFAWEIREDKTCEAKSSTLKSTREAAPATAGTKNGLTNNFNSSNGESSPSLEEKVDELFVRWDTCWTPGVAVAVVKDGDIVYSNGYGYAHMEYDIPVTPSTIFHIASVSKQFTTFSILLLEEDGKLSLDDEVGKYIEELPDFGKSITLRDLAHNISGLRDQWNLLGMAGWRLDDVITTDHVLRLVSRQNELNFEPGEEYLYSNTGFTLLAEVVARVSGKSFAEFTKERIFEPLGMTNTLFYDDHEKIVKNRAYSYGPREEGHRKRVLSYATVGATSLFTTVEDMKHWSNNFDNPSVGTPEMIEKMNTRAVLNNGDTISYALGQSVGTYKGLKRISHGGADAGYRTHFARFPEQDFSVIVFSNDASFNSTSMAMSVADIYLEDQLEEEKEEEEPDWEEKRVEVENRIKEMYCGQFELEPYNYITVSLENDTLFWETTTSRQKSELLPLSQTEFVIKRTGTKIEFREDNQNEFNKLVLRQNDREREAPRVEPFDPEQVDLSEYTGEFYSEEINTTYSFEIKKNEDGEKQLMAGQLRVGDFELTPLTPDFFRGAQWSFNRIEFVRDENGEVSGCKVSSGRVRNLRFEKLDQ